jgi:hypothetical protein
MIVERYCGRFEWTVRDWKELPRFYEKMGSAILKEWRVVRKIGDAPGVGGLYRLKARALVASHRETTRFDTMTFENRARWRDRAAPLTARLITEARASASSLQPDRGQDTEPTKCRAVDRAVEALCSFPLLATKQRERS